MALSRLFVAAECGLHFRNHAFPRPRRWFCSPAPAPAPTPLPPPPKKVSKRSEAAKERKTRAVESFVKRYMQLHPGVFPKAKEVHGEVGGSWYILKDILAEIRTNMLHDSQNKQIGNAGICAAGNSTCEATMIEQNADSFKLDRSEKKIEFLSGKSNKGELCSTTNTDSTVSDIEVQVEVSQIEKSTEDLTPTATVSVQLPYTTSQVVKGGESEVIPSENEDFGTDTHFLTPNHSAHERVIHCQAPNQIPSAIESNSSKELTSLVDCCKEKIDKMDGVSCSKVDLPKHETHSYPEEYNKHVINLVDIFRRNQSVSRDPNAIYEKNIQQTRSSYPREARTEDSERTGVKDLLDKIIELSKDKQNNGSCASVPFSKTVKTVELSEDKLKNGSFASAPSNKTDRFNKELRGFVHESINLPSLTEGSIHLNKTEDAKPEIQTEMTALTKTDISNLVVKEKEKQEVSSCFQTGIRKLQLDINKMAMDSTDIPYSEVISEESDSDVAAFDYPKSYDGVPHSVQGLNSNTYSADETDNHANHLMVKFLPKTAKTNDIGIAFCDCGPISEIRIVPTRRENRYNYAYVRFKTEEGLRKALGKADMAVCGADVAVEPAAPSMRQSRMLNMEPFNDADFPSSFLKNPTRTVMVHGLPDNLSFDHLRRALSYWGRVSGFAMGSSSSNVYVEFESEESKGRALAEASISVSGRRLSIFRVDHPKTTVLRISNVNPVGGLTKLRTICDSFGRVKRVIGRDIHTFDVHFKLSEWDNMVKILNRLNGLVADQNQWVVQPATVVPAEVLQDLWNEPEGGKHIHELIQNLCRRIEEKSIKTAPMLGLAREYYRDT